MPCPPHSSGPNVRLGCKCAAGYDGSVTATAVAPFYDISCVETRTAAPAQAVGNFENRASRISGTSMLAVLVLVAILPVVG